MCRITTVATSSGQKPFTKDSSCSNNATPPNQSTLRRRILHLCNCTCMIAIVAIAERQLIHFVTKRGVYSQPQKLLRRKSAAITSTTTTTSRLVVPNKSCENNNPANSISDINNKIAPTCNMSSSSVVTLSYDLLCKQNAETSNAIISQFAGSNANFDKLASFEQTSTVQRDVEDGIKLQKGIDFAKSKGVIDPNFVPEPYISIDVLGKTPDVVVDEILANVTKSTDSSKQDGTVIVLCGLSGTGKGTTTSKLRQKLTEEQGKTVVTWSNGNIFRSVTLLAATWCEQNCADGKFDPALALTAENLANFMSMLSFGEHVTTKHLDTHINGLGIDAWVSDIQNTDLKSPKVSQNIPTVAEQTQGEVILFAAKAIDIVKQSGSVVLLEGREQTVNYVRTPHRFILTLSDETLIGKRRAAQRIMGDVMTKYKNTESTPTNDEIQKTVESSLTELVQDL